MSDPRPASPFHLITDLLRERRVEADSVTFEMKEDWLQGRTSFGGLIATLAVQAMRDIAGAAWSPDTQLRGLQTSFVGPIGTGPMQVRVQTLREGKNVRQVQAHVHHAGELAGSLLGVFGSDRPTSLPVLSPQQPPAEMPADASKLLPFIPGVSPAFIQHIDAVWAEGPLPYSGQGGPGLSRIHARLSRQPADPLLTAELMTVLLADMPPTPLLSHLTRPTPASSLTWDLQLQHLPEAPSPDGWWRADTEVFAAAGGYVNQITRLWTPAGRLASLGYQVVMVYG